VSTRKLGRPPNWRREAVRELRSAAPDAVATLARQARVGDVQAARAVLDLLNQLDAPVPAHDRGDA
jgi:hypothetical protein